jgi:hypothetical protein
MKTLKDCVTKIQKIAILCLSAILICACQGSGTGDAEQTVGNSADPAQPPPNAGNSPPTISGKPPSAINVGEAFSYTPQVADADGDALKFSIENKPGWATFDAGTGTLSGTPHDRNIGSYDLIQISVSDGYVSVSTPRFSVDVTQFAEGSVTLSWAPPARNEDGTALTDLAAYKVYYGTESRSYDNAIEIENPGIVTYVIENLSPNKYYFAMTAIDSQRVESGYSNEIAETVD